MNLIRDVEYSNKQDVAEKIAEGIINEYYYEIINFYKDTLHSFFRVQGVDSLSYEWLLEGMEDSRNAISELKQQVHPATVWPTNEFVIDQKRGQVIRLNNLKSQGDNK